MIEEFFRTFWIVGAMEFLKVIANTMIYGGRLVVFLAPQRTRHQPSKSSPTIMYMCYLMSKLI
jgi:hypothetical protein